MTVNLKTVRLSQIALFSTLSALLVIFDFPILFVPGFYKMDFSETIVLISGFMMGPVSGVFVELFKIILKVLIKGTSTMGIGEFSNFLIGCSLVVSSSIFYRRNRTKKNAILALIIGVLTAVCCSVIVNMLLVLPLYSKILRVDIKKVVGENVFKYIALVIIPFNFIKSALSSILCFLIYKKVRHSLSKTFKQF